MAEVIYVEPDGSSHRVDALTGQTVMEGALLNMLPGIDGMCGGLLSCATCHCYVDDAWVERIDPPSDEEAEMLELVADRRPNSRLGCQIRIADEHAGLIIHLPDQK
ncbi:(2Fe-2S) ferredoxin [Sphingomonas sp. DBB INV C78]|uniref:2Fe-2S iron-sulfur cluster-binding protein n=1 Tax=Sphingomonas sp. DBB INV C78 TaxID=3349434 RepID=UPI0036D390FA